MNKTKQVLISQLNEMKKYQQDEIENHSIKLNQIENAIKEIKKMKDEEFNKNIIKMKLKIIRLN